MFYYSNKLIILVVLKICVIALSSEIIEAGRDLKKCKGTNESNVPTPSNTDGPTVSPSDSVMPSNVPSSKSEKNNARM
jgi:hypothetical protein